MTNYIDAHAVKMLYLEHICCQRIINYLIFLSYTTKWVLNSIDYLNGAELPANLIFVQYYEPSTVIWKSWNALFCIEFVIIFTGFS